MLHRIRIHCSVTCQAIYEPADTEFTIKHIHTLTQGGEGGSSVVKEKRNVRMCPTINGRHVCGCVHAVSLPPHNPL